MEARGHQVVAITSTAADGIAAVGDLRPDVVLLDLRLPECAADAGAGVAGVDAATTIRRDYPDTAIMVLSSLADPAAWSAVLELGVAAVMRKDHGVGAVADALDVIAAGGVVFDRKVGGEASQRAGRRRSGMVYVLTPREKEVLRRIVAGQSTGQMAQEMNIATSTLRTYVKNVLAKIGAHTRLQAAALATQGELQNELTA